ncbi:Nn.00g103990.m01.CDS01 [Neocucurbitaria sp. VM-36]
MAPRRARERKRQTKLDFSSAAKSSSPKGSTSTTMGNSPSRPAKATPTTASNMLPRKASTKAMIYSSSEDELQAETDRGMRLGMPVESAPHGMFDGSDVGAASSQSSEEEEEPQIKTKSAVRKRRRARDNTKSEDEEAITVNPRKRQRRSAADVGDPDEGAEELRMPAKRRRKKRQDTPDEESEEETPPRSTQRKATKRQTTSDEEQEEQTPPRSTRRIIRRRAPSGDEEDLDVMHESGDRKSDGEEHEDLKEDLAFLRSSPLPDRGRLRSTQGKPMNERQKALEALKKRRAGTNEPSSSATPSRRKPVVVESESDSELEVIKEEKDSDLELLDPVEDDDEDEEDEEGDDREANILDMFQEDGDDAGFIDDDAEAVIGEPSATADLDELRLVAGLSRAKSKDLFKHAVEWMVMKKINPAFNSTKNIYTITFRKLDDEVKGLAGSKFTSSVWTPDFTRAIRARPDLMVDEISLGRREVMSPHCEACNRSNHTATFELMLTGQPYDAETLEPLGNDSDSDSNSDSESDSELSADSEVLLNGEKPAYDAQGERLPPEAHRFPLGSTCKANAQVAHTLHHWRYHLYQWVKDYLAREGHLTAEKLVKRDKWNDKKRQKAAHKIVDGMERDGEIKKLYKLYKEQVEFAIEAVNDYKHGWGRRR